MNIGSIAANKMLQECGLDSVLDLPLEMLVAGRGAILRYSELKGSDGRIVFGNAGKAVITINSNIEYEGKRRFTIAHELGHFEMHKNIETHNDSDLTLNNFRNGDTETEANQFASELLMPEHVFVSECTKKRFSPKLLRDLAEKFNSSITSVAFRYLEIGTHPIYIFCSHANIVKYWKRTDGYYLRVKDITKLTVPEESVAAEFYKDGRIYSKEESAQQIFRSTWFESGKYDKDDVFWEYCIVMSKYNTVFSIVWQD
mgnify:CR=1 FL=1